MNLSFFSMLCKAVVCFVLLRRVSQRKTMSLLHRVTAAILLKVFLLGRETFNEQTFWHDTLIFGTFLNKIWFVASLMLLFTIT
jgi:hypothetical protein